MAKKKDNPEVRIVFNEAGTSGLKQFSGFVNEAYNAQLFWPTVQPLYSRLRRSMPEIVMIRQAFTAWARNTAPQVDLPDEATDDDKRYQEFIYSDFENMEGGYTKFIDTLVNHVPFDGWGWWEAVPSVRRMDWKAPDDWQSQEDDGLFGLRRLAWRDTSTFYGWEFDDKKNMVGLNQQDFPYPPVLLEKKNGLHITFGDPNNPEGLSPLEAVWRLERIRFGLEVVQGIGYEHAAGYLNVNKTEAGTLSEDDKSNVRAAARAILTAQEGNYALWPFGMNGEVKDIGFQASSAILEAIRHYSILALSVYTMQWMALNTLTGSGSLAAADDSSSMGVFTFNAMMDGFAAQYDQQIGRRLWDWNKASFPNATKRPVIKFSHIDKSVALGEMGSFMQQMNTIMPIGDEDLKAIRKRSGFLPANLPEETLEQKAVKDAAKLDKQATETKEVIQQALHFASRRRNG